MPIRPHTTPHPGDPKKPEKPKGFPGLWLYGALTILGGLALVFVAE